MTTDLWMLVYTRLLSLFFFLTYGSGRLLAAGGIEWGFGNREKPIAAPEWTARGQRAHQNLVENLGPFAILVIVAHLTGKANSITALGATLFFWVRVAHAATYLAGIIYARTAAFFVGVVGEVMILSQLF